jgi:hypothetical protein
VCGDRNGGGLVGDASEVGTRDLLPACACGAAGSSVPPSLSFSLDAGGEAVGGPT